MVLLGDEAQLEARFSPCADSANLDARLVHGLCRTYRRLGDRFGRTRWNSLVDVGHVKSHFSLLGLETVLASVQYSCTLCVERATGLEIGLDAPDVSPRLRWSCGNLFWSIWR